MATLKGLEQTAQKQFGLITREQMTAAGLTPSAIRHRAAGHDWESEGRGVFRLRGVHKSWSQYAQMRLLQIGPDAVLSHGTAAFLWELDGFDRPGLIHLSSQHQVRKLESTIIHRVEQAAPSMLVKDLRTTHLARTLVDLADVLPEKDLELALDSARRKKPMLEIWLNRYVTELGQRHGRKGLATLLRLLGERTQSLDSGLEVKVMQLLRKRGVPEPIHGYSVFDPLGRYIMKVDHGWPLLKVALHDDSYRFHSGRSAFERDAKQRSLLQALGWANIVVTARSLHEGWWIDALCKVLLARLAGLDTLDAIWPSCPRNDEGQTALPLL